MNLGEFHTHLTEQLLAPRTIKLRVEFAESRLRDWGTLLPPTAVLVAWLSSYTGWTHLTYRQHLGAIHRWLVEIGELDHDPLARMRRPPTPRPRPKPLSDAELARVLGSAEGDLYAWLQLGNLQGLRATEIVRVRGEHITEEGLFVRGKGGTEDTLPTHPAIWELAQQYPADGFWFPSALTERGHLSESKIGNTVRAHFEVNGIRTGSIHRMRHTYGTRLARNKVPTRVIQKLMRHASIQTTELYLEVLHEELVAGIRTLAA